MSTLIKGPLELTGNLSLLILLFGLAIAAEGDEGTSVKTVRHVDLRRYTGVWYEYARIPNSFQDDCEHNTTATYRLREDGRIEVINRCVDAEDDTIEAKGVARIVDMNTNAKLEVSFVSFLGFNFFWGDYWIIGLADDYRFAVVGVPSRKYGWILSRNPALSEEDFETVKKILTGQGYNPDDFLISKNIY
jgi:apolipoprotein D and lipocalin family protein